MVLPPPGAAAHARLVDPPDGPARTTATLVASLRDRLRALGTITGAEAVGSVIAGYAAIGRRAAQTAEGQRLAAALRAGRAGTNGESIWSAVGVDRMASVPPSPVLDHLRNDIALLLADDLDAVLDGAGAASEVARSPRDSPGGSEPSSSPDDTGPVDSVDYLVGMWAASRELVALVEALAEPTRRAANTVTPAEGYAPPDGPLLR